LELEYGSRNAGLVVYRYISDLKSLLATGSDDTEFDSFDWASFGSLELTHIWVILFCIIVGFRTNAPDRLPANIFDEAELGNILVELGHFVLISSKLN